MDNNQNYNENNIGGYCRNIMINHTIIMVLLLFVIVYIIINYNTIIKGDIFGGYVANTIIITGIIFLITYFFIMLDDEVDDNNQIETPMINNNTIKQEEIYKQYKNNIIPKYKIINKNNMNHSTQIATIPVNNTNSEFNSKYLGNSIVKPVYLEDNNQNDNFNNIFITHKNKSKFGIKF
jgi:hypothetical protein